MVDFTSCKWYNFSMIILRRTIKMDKKPLFHVKKRTLLAIAGCVWFLAGFNVARLGFIAYSGLEKIYWYYPLLSAVVF